MTNYEMLLFLIEDEGWYTAAGHFKRIKSKFPGLTENHIKSLRGAIQNSTLITAKSKIVEGNKIAYKIISVSPIYNNYARVKSPYSSGKYTDSYIRSEPPEVGRMILLVQQFNQLLATVTHQRAY
ncbi:Uncharacterised protein [Serratia entomophila]|uniref:hypothetical protein n=1 Tax=Serratia entomophila TaxID=42906 RepID=UPI00217A78A0|nr:hypothetical protein [Serratia entomophila]CAI1574268.1 Uncharacterised protein [Serratia entomophila]